LTSSEKTYSLLTINHFGEFFSKKFPGRNDAVGVILTNPLEAHELSLHGQPQFTHKQK